MYLQRFGSFYLQQHATKVRIVSDLPTYLCRFQSFSDNFSGCLVLPQVTEEVSNAFLNNAAPSLGVLSGSTVSSVSERSLVFLCSGLKLQLPVYPYLLYIVALGSG